MSNNKNRSQFSSEHLKQIFSKQTEEDDEKDLITHEGYLLKVSKTGKLKKVYFKLVGKDIYCK